MSKRKEIRTGMILCTVGILVSLLGVGNVVAEFTLTEVSIEPAEPAPLSTVTLTATFGGDNITSVNLSLKECNASQGICFNQITVPMELLGSGAYQAAVTLEKEQADYIQYYFDIIGESGSERLENNSWKYNLTMAPVGDDDDDIGDDDDDDDSTNGGNGGQNGSPGFELIALLIAVVIGALILRRKR